MTEVIVPIILGVIASGGLWTFIQFMVARRDDKKKAKADKTNEIAKTMDAMKNTIQELSDTIATIQESVNKTNADMVLQSETLMAMSQDRIIWLSREFLGQGWIYDDDLGNMHRIANSYRALGGNDIVKTYMDKVDQLTVKVRK